MAAACPPASAPACAVGPSTTGQDAKATVSTPGDTPGDANAQALSLTAAWRQVCDNLRRMRELDEANSALTARTFGVPVSLCRLGIYLDDALERARLEVFEALVRKAAKELPPPGTTLCLDSKGIARALGAVAGQPSSDQVYARRTGFQEAQVTLNQTFDPDAVWRWLHAHYGGKAGERAAWHQSAATLTEHLRLRCRPPTMRGQSLVLAASAWTTEFASGSRYSIETRDRLYALARALASFAIWAGDAITARALQEAGRDLFLDGTFVSRGKVSFPPGFTWTTFKEKVEILVSPALTPRFREFIAEFGSRPDAE